MLSCTSSTTARHLITRKHYGIADAFFDLATTGFQATLATNVSRGDTCVVATKDADGQIRFSLVLDLARVESSVVERRQTPEGLLRSIDEIRDAVEGRCRSRMGCTPSSLTRTAISKDNRFFSKSEGEGFRGSRKPESTSQSESPRGELARITADGQAPRKISVRSSLAVTLKGQSSAWYGWLRPPAAVHGARG